jgi:hypothetical protein
MFDPVIQSMFHYLHLLSSNIAVFALYIGMKDTADTCLKGRLKVRKHSFKIMVGVLLTTILGVFFMAYFSAAPYDPKIESPFLLMRFQPTLVMVALVIWESRHFAKSIEMLYLPIVSIMVSFLMLDIWLGRYSDIKGWANLYTLTHSFQDIFLVLSGCVLVLFAINIWYSHRIGRLFVCGVSSRVELGEFCPIPIDE